jgi:hypothetical protein
MTGIVPGPNTSPSLSFFGVLKLLPLAPLAYLRPAKVGGSTSSQGLAVPEEREDELKSRLQPFLLSEIQNRLPKFSRRGGLVLH